MAHQNIFEFDIFHIINVFQTVHVYRTSSSKAFESAKSGVVGLVGCLLALSINLPLALILETVPSDINCLQNHVRI